MCGLCCSKTKLKQIKKNEDKEEDEKRFHGTNEKAFEPFEEEPVKFNHSKSLNEQVQKKQAEEESMEEDKHTTYETLTSADEQKERKVPSRNEWMSDLTGFPSFSSPKVIDKTVLPNMINSGTKEEKTSKAKGISIDETEFPQAIPPVIEDSKEEEDDEDDTENNDDMTEFPVNAPRVDSDDEGTSFPYNKPPNNYN